MKKFLVCVLILSMVTSVSVIAADTTWHSFFGVELIGLDDDEFLEQMSAVCNTNVRYSEWIPSSEPDPIIHVYNQEWAVEAVNSGSGKMVLLHGTPDKREKLHSNEATDVLYSIHAGIVEDMGAPEEEFVLLGDGRSDDTSNSEDWSNWYESLKSYVIPYEDGNLNKHTLESVLYDDCYMAYYGFWGNVFLSVEIYSAPMADEFNVERGMTYFYFPAYEFMVQGSQELSMMFDRPRDHFE